MTEVLLLIWLIVPKSHLALQSVPVLKRLTFVHVQALLKASKP